ncbi:MAG TPA: formyltransferase family protein [Puia sp.]
MRIVILTASRRGTASYCLPALLDHADAEIAGVIFSSGRPGNRMKFYRRKLKKMLGIGVMGALNGIRMRKWFSIDSVEGRPIEDIEEICLRRGVPFREMMLMNSPETADLLRSMNADLGLSLGNSYLSPKIFTAPRHGMLNIHGEVLPAFQNAQSVIWQLYEGSGHTGYTIHKIERKIDTGEILKQESFPILFRDRLQDTVTDTCAEILRRACDGLVDTVNHFTEYDRLKKPQGAGRHYTTPSFRQFLRIKRNFNKLKKERKSQ